MASNPNDNPIAQRHSLLQISAFMFHLVTVILFMLLTCAGSQAQEITARISFLNPAEPLKIKVEGTYPNGSGRWPFRNAYGRLIGLGDRIQSLSLTDANGAKLSVGKVAPGEFTTAQPAIAFAYEVSLGQPPNPADGAHISWLTERHGYLMLADLLPDLQTSTVRVEFSLPPQWNIASSAVKGTRGWYDLPDKAGAVFFVGSDLQEERKRISRTDFSLVTAGAWSFSRKAAIEKVAKIIKDHSKHTGFDQQRPVTVMLAPFPGGAAAQRWSAETRGSNVVLLASGHPSAGLSLGQLSVVLCHELFHLWVPNELSLEGDYDWFFEGFTLYQALGCAVRLGFIDFQEYLDTLARVYDSYLLASERERLSLIEASRRRWTSGSSLVYDKGMLVAFLYDLKLRSASRNRRSLEDVYRELFRRFVKGSSVVNGNDAIVSVLAEQTGDRDFATRHIQQAGPLALETTLPGYGIRVTGSEHRMRFQIDEGASSEQRELLTALGYRKRQR